MVWTEQPVHFVDFEGSTSSGVLEYGVATLLGGRVASAVTRLCAPTGRIRPEDTEVHGLRGEALARFEPFSSDWGLFAASMLACCLACSAMISASAAASSLRS